MTDCHDSDCRLRLERWVSPDGRRIHMAVGVGMLAYAHAVALSPDGRSLSVGGRLLPKACADADRDALLDVLPLDATTPADLSALSLFDDGDMLLVHLVRMVEAVRDRYDRPPVPAKTGGDEPHRRHASLDQAVARHPVPDRIELPRASTKPTTTTLDRLIESAPDAYRGWEKRWLADWFASLRATVHPAGIPQLTTHSWTPLTFAHYTAPGEAGIRRAQAARLQPGFVGLMEAVPKIVRLIDTGRPFEAALRDWIAEAYGPHIPMALGGLTMARLRRMRAIRPSHSCPHSPSSKPFLATACLVQPDRLPDTAVGWWNFSRMGGTTLFACFHDGFDLPTLVRGIPSDWDLARLAGPNHSWTRTDAARVRSELQGTADMFRRCAQTLVADVVRAYGLTGVGTEATAVDILFRGMSLRRVWERQRLWHDRLHAFEASMPMAADMEWPALFAPFEAGGGIVVRCLTRSSQIRAEGLRGPDPDGIPGLSHCVGGFEADCMTGRAHIASITGPGPGASRTRLSTLEIGLSDGKPFVRQHQGHANAPPPPASSHAEAALLAAIADGRVTLDPRAAVARPMPAVDAGTSEGLLRDHFEAWRPYLAPDVARAGPDALPAIVAGIRRRLWAANGAGDPDRALPD